MENKTCEGCRSFPGMGYYCPIIGRFCDPNNEDPCEFFEKPFGRKPTNGDVIRQEGDQALLDYRSSHKCDVCIYAAPIDAAPACNRPDDKSCMDGVKAWLNAPAESNTESEE